MDENIVKFQEKLKDLAKLGKKKKSILEVQEINDFFHDMELSPEQMEKDSPNHPGFKARTDGTIIGKRGRPMKGHIDRCGYKEVLLSENGRTNNARVHRLIAETFIPNPDNLRDVNHKDGNKLNNDISNLEWVSHSENVKHSYNNGLQNKVRNKHGTYNVLSNDDKQTISSLHKDGLLDREIAEKIGCSRELVSRKIREEGLR